MDKLITKGFSDGMDFFRPKSTKEKRLPTGHGGFGALICEYSNMLHFHKSGEVLTKKKHAAQSDLEKLIASSLKNYKWVFDNSVYNNYQSKSWDNESLEKISGRTMINSCVRGNHYLQLDKSKFVAFDDLPDQYITTQEVGHSTKCKITQEQWQEIYKKYNLPIIDLSKMEKYGLAKAAYIIDNAKYHVGMDSGASHFALTIKPKDDVHIYIPKGKLTNVGRAWVDYNYNVTEV